MTYKEYCKEKIAELEEERKDLSLSSKARDNISYLIEAIENSISKRPAKVKEVDKLRDYYVFYCPTCTSRLTNQYPFCPICGQELNWDYDE